MAQVNASVRVTAAIIAGKSAEMDHAAHRGLNIARTLAAKHAKTNAYMDSLKVVSVRGLTGTGTLVTDRLIIATDPGAAAIENGHLVRVEGARRVKWIPGQRILGRTVSMM